MIGIVIKLVLVPIAAIVLALMAAAPDVSDECGPAPHPQDTPVPVCCLTADCLFVNCGLSANIDNKALLAASFVPLKMKHVGAGTRAGEPSGAPPDLIRPPRSDPASEIPSPFNTQYFCRNCLGSEEPSQV
jgi:hypothetical protein